MTICFNIITRTITCPMTLSFIEHFFGNHGHDQRLIFRTYRVFKVLIFENGTIELYGKDVLLKNISQEINEVNDDNKVCFKQSEVPFDYETKISSECLELLKKKFLTVKENIS